MPFDLAVWKAEAALKLKSFKRTAAQASSYMTYTTLATMTLWPVVEAIGKGDVNGAITALMGAGAAAGAGIITQKALDWKGKTDAEIQRKAAQWIDESVTQDKGLRQSLDAILTRLDAPALAQTGLSETDREWFVQTLREEAKRIGSTVNVTVYTDGGAHVGGDVNTGGGSFAGRDQIIYNYYCAPIGERKLSEAEFKRVLADYLRHVADANQHARLFGETPKSKTRRGLEKIFVPLTLRKFDPPSRKEIEEIERELKGDGALAHQKAMLLAHDRKRGDGDEVALTDLLTQKEHERSKARNKLAVVGGAGCGKSTLLAYLAAMLCAEHMPFALPAGRATLVPMIVPFRAYRLYVDECQKTPGMRISDPRAGTLAGFIPWWLKRRSGLMDASQDFFDRLLRSGGCLLMLDGLDEVVNREERQRVRNLVEQLVNDTYPGNIVIVTAREAGYREDAVFGDDFLRMNVQPLSEPQIEALVRKWCTELYPADIDDQTARLMAAINDINARRSDADLPPLISTPLMTTMVVSVKESETELPRERAKLYEACVKVVLQAQYLPDDPDDTRKAVVEWGGPWEDQRTWLSTLALEMHGGGKAGAFVTEQKVREVLKGALSAEALQKFIEALRNRGGLLEERVELFQFAHLTFQEFLAARAIAKQRAGGLPLLQPHLEDAWWREVALLTYGFAQHDYEPFAREYLGWLSDQGLVGLELAGAALLELERPNPELRAAQAQRLSAALTNPTVRATGGARGRAGRVLAELGDPREGVLNVETMPMCYVPSGEFIMGGEGQFDGKPEHVQRVKGGFWTGRYPVTQAQFAQFVGADGYKNKNFWPEAIAAKRWENGKFRDRNDKWRERSVPYDGAFMLPNHPIVGVSWYEALAFCRWLGSVLPSRFTGGVGGGFRLPTEAEWEYAARGPRFIQDIPRDALLIRSAIELSRVQSNEIDALRAVIQNRQSKIVNRRAYPWGDEPDAERMNYDRTGIGTTSAIGAFPLGNSPFGCEDMSGNVWEWTMTKWREDYKDYDRNVDNKADGSETRRVVRGGSFNYNDNLARCAYRNYTNPDLYFVNYGFRVVASPIDP